MTAINPVCKANMCAFKSRTVATNSSFMVLPFVDGLVELPIVIRSGKSTT